MRYMWGVRPASIWQNTNPKKLTSHFWQIEQKMSNTIVRISPVCKYWEHVKHTAKLPTKPTTHPKCKNCMKAITKHSLTKEAIIAEFKKS